MNYIWRCSILALGLSMVASPVAPSHFESATATTAAATPAELVNELLAADRAFAAASAKTNLVDGLSAMFADDVSMPLPSVAWADGRTQVTEALRANPDNPRSRAEWTPIRGGVSADGRHGFTFGYLSVHKADSSVSLAKYMAYWIKGTNGWRVAVYKRAGRPAGAVAMSLMPPALPERLVAPTRDAAILAAHKTSLMQAEQDFSDEAQKIGIGPAFTKFGTADAVNMGRDAEFLVGNEKIGGPPGTEPTSAAWKSDRAIVASSGDLGISMGFIRPHANPDKPAAAFFTIWRRASLSAPWRYVAE